MAALGHGSNHAVPKSAVASNGAMASNGAVASEGLRGWCVGRAEVVGWAWYLVAEDEGIRVIT